MGEVDSLEDVKKAASDPEGFLKRVLTSSGPVARKLLYAQVRPQLETPMRNHGLVWEDVVPILEELDSIEKLQKAVSDPEGFFERVLTSSGPVARKLVYA